MLGEGNSKPLDRELDNVFNGPEGQQDSESVLNRECSSQENEIRNIYRRKNSVGHDRLTKSIEILSGELNARMSKELDSLVDTMKAQINRATRSAINDKVLPE